MNDIAPRLKTSKGKPVAKFTLFCKFLPEEKAGKLVEGQFTYRSDRVTIAYARSNKHFENEKQALVHKLNEILERVKFCVMYDNSQPKGFDVLFKFANGQEIINNL